MLRQCVQAKLDESGNIIPNVINIKYSLINKNGTVISGLDNYEWCFYAEQDKFMTDSIIVAIIAGLTTIIGTALVNHREAKKDSMNRAVREALIDEKLESIEEKLDEHNHYAEKFGDIEKSIVRIDTMLNSHINKKKGKK